MTPVYPDGRPIICASHAIVTCSSSVAAGDVAHDMHWAPSVAVSISARTEGGLLFPGKYANHPGWFQWVIPGRTSWTKSTNNVSNGSPSAGGAEGNFRKTSHGRTSGVTGSSPTFSI